MVEQNMVSKRKSAIPLNSMPHCTHIRINSYSYSQDLLFETSFGT